MRAEYRGPRRQVYLFKPLTVLFIIAIALIITGPPSERYRAAILAGLACSLAGDVFLMLPGDRFLPGVASFLLAHLAYLVAFTTDAPFGTAPLFVISDAALALSRFRRPFRAAQALILSTYYAAQLLIAWSVGN